MKKDLLYILLLIGIVIGAIWFSIVQYDKGYDDCNSINGEYIIVDKKWNGKNFVKIYGCVEK